MIIQVRAIDIRGLHLWRDVSSLFEGKKERKDSSSPQFGRRSFCLARLKISGEGQKSSWLKVGKRMPLEKKRPPSAGREEVWLKEKTRVIRRMHGIEP